MNLDSFHKRALDEAETAMKHLFEECDKDKKGLLDGKKLAEGIARLLPPLPGFNQGHPGAPPPGFGPGNNLAGVILRMAGKNNRATLDQLLAATEKLFKEWDKDSKG